MTSRYKHILAIFLALAALSADQIAPPDQVLKDKGLTKSSSYYLLDADLKLNDSLRAIRAGESQLQTYTRKRRAIEADIANAEHMMEQWAEEIDDIHQKMKNMPDAEAYNHFVDQNNDRVRKIQEGKKYIAQRNQDLTKLTAPTDHITATLKLADDMEDATKQYDALAKDEQVTSALAAINAKSTVKYRLGPSAMFKDQLPRIRAQAEKIGASAVKFQMDGGVAHIPVVLNGSVVVPMIVDSGASLVTITSDIADKLSLSPKTDDGKATLTVADGKTVEARITTLATVRVGQYTVKNVSCAILPASASGAGCLLGGTFLQSFVYQMDLAGGVLRLSPVSAQAGTGTDAHIGSSTSKPSIQPETPAPATQPLAAAQRQTLEIDADVDGADEIKLSAKGLTWSHKTNGWPTAVHVNGKAWNPKSTPTLALTDELAFLQQADLGSARVSEKAGRGKVMMESADDGPTVYFSDPGAGRAKYSIKISFSPK